MMTIHRIRMMLLSPLAFLCMAAACLGLVAGCTTRGPVNSDQMPSLAYQALPPDSGDMIQCSPGEWFPNVKGFNDVRSNPFAPVSRQSGVVVLTRKGVFFVEWDKRTKAYDLVKRLPVESIRALSLDSEGASRRLVIQKQDYGYDTFGLTQAGGLLGDKSECQAMLDQLQKLLPAGQRDGRMDSAKPTH